MPLGNSWSVIDEVDCGGAKPRGARAAAAKAAAKTATRGAAVKTPANARLPIQGRRFFRFKQEIKKQRRRREGKRQGDDARPTLFFFSLSFSKPQPRPLNFFTSTTTTTATSNTTSTTKNSDEENPYLRSGPPPPAPPPSLRARVAREASSRWYLWAALAFASLLVGGLVVFREALLEGAAGSGLGRRVGLPTLAIGNNAAEACATECADASAELGGSAAAALLSAIEAETTAAAASAGSSSNTVDDAYSTCYAKCVAQETRDVVQEHEQFVREEKEIAAEEEKAKAAAADGGAAAAAAAASGAASGAASASAAGHHAVDAKTQEDKELEALLEEVLDSMP